MDNIFLHLTELKAIFLGNNKKIIEAYDEGFNEHDFKILKQPIAVPSHFFDYGHEFCRFITFTNQWPIDFGHRLIRPISEIGNHSHDQDITFMRYSVDLAPSRDEFMSEDLLWKHERVGLMILDQGAERERLVILKGGETGWLSPDGFQRRGGLMSALNDVLTSNLKTI